MKVFYWNIRGIGNSESQIALADFYRNYKPVLLFDAEPMVQYSSIPSWYWNNINVNNFCLNKRNPLMPNLWALWRTDVSLVVNFVSSQCIVLEGVFNNVTVYIAGVYASTSYLQRRQLWADLTMLQTQYTAPWLFVGDFNAILRAHEKQGTRLPPSISCMDFMTWTNANLLLHLETVGVNFTWCNGRLNNGIVSQRLDRAICNEAWIDFWQISSCDALV